MVGAGRVGLHVIRIGTGFGMRVLAYDEAPHAFYSELLDFRYVGFAELMRESDVITLHVPLTPTTRHMINREALALCRPGVLLINTARGGLIDSGALIEALDSGQSPVSALTSSRMNASSEGEQRNSQREDCGTGPELSRHNDQRNLGAAGIGILQAGRASPALESP